MIESVEVVIRQPGQPDRTQRLSSGTTRIGRADDNEMVLADVGVSRWHARLVLDEEQVLLEDLGSGNGTYFNGSRIQSQVLQNGDEVVVDPFVLLFRIRGARAPSRREETSAPARLEVVVGTGLAGSTYPLTKDHPLTIGRSEERDLVVPDPAASRHHATVVCEDGKWVLRDEGAANGIFVNESRVRRAELADSDVIRIGNTELRFVLAARPLGETTTQVVPGEVWNPQAGRSQASAPAASTPGPHPDQAASQGRSRGPMVALVLGALLLLLCLLALLSVGLLGVVLYYTGDLAAEASDAPPTWHVEHTEPLPTAPEACFELGIQRLRAGEPGTALEAFHATLVAQPGHPPSERFAHAAAELVVMEALTEVFTESEKQHRARLAERDQLLERSRRSGRVGRTARADLVSRFADDPVVTEALELPPSEAAQSRREQAERAGTLEPAEAFAVWSELLDSAPAAERATAREARDLLGRELSELTHRNWIASLVSEEQGDAVATAEHLAEVRRTWPDSPALALHTLD